MLNFKLQTLNAVKIVIDYYNIILNIIRYTIEYITNENKSFPNTPLIPSSFIPGSVTWHQCLCSSGSHSNLSTSSDTTQSKVVMSHRSWFQSRFDDCVWTCLHGNQVTSYSKLMVAKHVYIVLNILETRRISGVINFIGQNVSLSD